MVPKPKNKVEKGDQSMIIESMHINQFDEINYNGDNLNGKVENISNAEAARIMKSKLGKASSQSTEVPPQCSYFVTSRFD